MIKLLAVDVDGTLLRSDHSLSSANARAVRLAKAAGVHVLLATGRPTLGVSYLLDDLGFTAEDYIIGFNGARIERARTRELIAYTPLTGADFRKLYAIGVEMGFEPYAFDSGSCIAPADYVWAFEEGRANRIPVHITPMADIPDDRPLAKILFSGAADFMAENVPKIPAGLLNRYSHMPSDPRLYEFLRSGVDKGAAVEMLAQKLGVSRAEIMCVGDSGNDVHMLEYAGIGVAMGNGSEAAKRAAGYITRSNDEDGLAHAIDELILNQHSRLTKKR